MLSLNSRFIIRQPKNIVSVVLSLAGSWFILSYFLELYIIHKEEILEQQAEVLNDPFITDDSSIVVFNTSASVNEMKMSYSSMPYISKKEFVTLVSKGDKVIMGINRNEVELDNKTNTCCAKSNARITIYSLKKGNRILSTLDDHNRVEYILLQIGLGLGFIIWAFVLLSYFKLVRLKNDRYFTVIIVLVLVAVFLLCMTTIINGH